jgi:hypothetical protein
MLTHVGLGCDRVEEGGHYLLISFNNTFENQVSN